MSLFIQLLSIVISTPLFLSSFSKIKKNKINIFRAAELMFYIVHVVPLLLLISFEFEIAYLEFPNVYYAITSENVRIIYSIFISFVMILLHFFSMQIHDEKINIHYNNKFNNVILTFLFTLSFSPLISVFFSPDITDYFQYTYIRMNKDSASYLYHIEIVSNLCLVSLCSLVLIYFIKPKNNTINLLLIIASFFLCYIDGKRAIPAFLCLSIIFIDYIKGDLPYNKLRSKSLILLLIVTGVFIFNGFLTGKVDSYDDLYSHLINYELYFSRMSSSMTAIYDILNESEILDFPGQSILYDILYFIPREYWLSKPLSYCFYYTPFADGSYVTLHYNLLVNIWTEYISNFGFLAPFFAIFYIGMIYKISQVTNSEVIKFISIIYISMYSIFGFEFILIYIYTIWLILVIVSCIKKTFNLKT